MVKGQSLQPTIEKYWNFVVKPTVKVEKGSWSKVKAKFQPVKTLTTVADLPTALTYMTPPWCIPTEHISSVNILWPSWLFYHMWPLKHKYFLYQLLHGYIFIISIVYHLWCGNYHYSGRAPKVIITRMSVFYFIFYLFYFYWFNHKR